MKRYIILTIIVTIAFAGCKSKQKSGESESIMIPDMAHNSMNSLDWSGTYMGVLPCADGEGIKTEITLMNNLTYEMRTTHLEKDRKTSISYGTFRWDDTGNRIILGVEDKTEEGNMFHVGENVLFKLDKDGNRIKGSLEENYTLKRVNMNTIIGKHWKLVQLLDKSIVSVPGQRREAYMMLHEEENRISGNGGCNNFFGTYELLDNNGIRISQIGSTKMMCPDMEPETKFFRTLESVTSYNVQGETLILYDSPASIAAKFKVSQNDN